ncbi:MAG: CRISPR system precrRNA processing endoribonuclease RAMP protein Cas6 [Firmicutes bacterium]|nr:CRISPR system precrRNA processing endoribonuclease RAMP protein Cas6 [Bacillota bacterium]
MIAKAEFKLGNIEGINYNMASLFQGVIMEYADEDFAEKEHISSIRSYSQYIDRRKGEYYWTVSTLTDIAKENIIDRLVSQNRIHLKNKDIVLPIEEVKVTLTSFDELFEKNYFTDTDRYIKLNFKTPTAFKSDGKYINYPTVRHIILSLINKHDFLSDVTYLGQGDNTESLLSKIDICSYDLKSTYFHLEGVKIPSFVGRVTLKVTGGKVLSSMVNMLCDFAEYSGVGIKSAIGMGAILKYKRERRDKLE